jgi:hypothetical protein
MRNISGRAVLLLGVLAIAALTAVDPAAAATISAASTSRADVNAAIAAAEVGDTVRIPAGTSTWSSPITVTKAIYIMGAGPGSTRLINGASGETPIFNIALTADGPMEISGIYFQDAGLNFNSDGIHISNEAVHEEQVRIYNCVFDSFIFGIHVHAAHGVVHDSTFINNDHNFRVVGYRSGDLADHAFDPPPWAWNSTHFWVMEDCVINYSRDTSEVLSVDTEFPANYMIRHTTWNVNRPNSAWYDNIDMHGRTGTTSIENDVGVVIYNNTVNFTGNTSGGQRFADIRGGRFNLIYNNTVTGVSSIGIELSANPAGSPRPTDTYIWNNGAALRISTSDGVALNVHYFLTPPPGYVELRYPHPLRSGGSSTPPTAPSTLTLR